MRGRGDGDTVTVRHRPALVTVLVTVASIPVTPAFR